MLQEKPGFEQFLEAVDTANRAFVQDLHNYLLENGCKITVEEKKSGWFASYKHITSRKSIVNILFRKKGMFVRIYGELAGNYHDFLSSLPADMLEAIGGAGTCKRLVLNECSPKCSGYDFTIGGKRFQKCKYGCFEFLVTQESGPYIKSFAEQELSQRTML